MDSNQKLLIIVESPSKTKTIQKFVPNASVIASVGHFKDLAKNDLSIDIDNDFAMKFETIKGKNKFLQELRKEAKKADRILIATDPDREGEAIAFDIASSIKESSERIDFNEITKSAVMKAIENPRTINLSLVDAQRARRAIDRIVGFTFSPVLWKTLRNVKGSGLSAGRVQSVALKLLVDKEKDRNRFVKNRYHEITVSLLPNGGKDEFLSKLISVNSQNVATGEDFDKYSNKLNKSDLMVIGEEESKKILSQIESKDTHWIVDTLETKPTKSSSPPPFTTSTLQQESSRRLGFSPKKTMSVAQKLYEQGFITYMRTDSTSLSNEGLNAAREFILKEIGDDYLSQNPLSYANKIANAQEAHEAIRPAGSTFNAPQALNLEPSQEKLYGLILSRTLASQMKSARYERTNVIISKGDLKFASAGNVTVFEGYTRAYNLYTQKGFDKSDAFLPNLALQQELDLMKSESIEKFTTPPRRFSEAMLVKEMESRGIGRPSTYSSIIDKLYNRDYAINKNKAIIPTYLGIAVSQLLENHYSDLFNEAFTAGMEERLDSISRSEDSYLEALNNFYFGTKNFSGVANLLDREIDIIKACSVNSSSGHLIRIGKYGPYIEEADGNITIPNELMFGDLSEEEIDKIKDMTLEDNIVGTTDSGEKILLKSGKYGPYLETGNEKKRQSIPKMYRDILMTEELAKELIGLPKLLGLHPEFKENIMLYFGPYGPYLKYGKKNISIKNNENPLSLSLSEAIQLISEGNKTYEPTSLGKHPDTGNELIIKSGRYGPYITDGKRNISLKGKDIDSFSLEEGIALFDE